jgi:predicted dehydrogenase
MLAARFIPLDPKKGHRMAINPPLGRKLRMGLVGGGGGFIGRVHALAAALDNRAVLVAGALSSDAAKARTLAPDFDIPPPRAYGSFQEMVQTELALPPEERIDFVSIATPNHTHFEIARAFVEAGFNVLCDKPMTFNLEQAEELARIVERAGVVFAVTHNYTGYPLVRQARDMVRAGELGEINAVRVCYLQGSLHRQRTPEQQKRFAWKTDPARAGMSGCFGDIGIHAYNLLRFITGLVAEEVSCTLRVFHPEGRLDDYGTAVIRFRNGAIGTLTASRVSHGRENDLWIEIDGTKESLEWHQEEPNWLWLRINGQPHRLLTSAASAPYLTATAQRSCRLPGGHPEGFLEAFANIYTAAYEDIIARALGRNREAASALYPTVADGVDGINFVTRCVASSRGGGAWVSLGEA